MLNTKQPNHQTQLFLIDDSVIFIDALKDFLKRYDDLNIIGVSYSAKQAMSLIPVLKPDIILLDLEMPEISGLELLPIIRELQPEAKVIIVTLLGFRQIAKSAGADDYVEKDKLNSALLPAIRRLSNVLQPQY